MHKSCIQNMVFLILMSVCFLVLLTHFCEGWINVLFILSLYFRESGAGVGMLWQQQEHFSHGITICHMPYLCYCLQRLRRNSVGGEVHRLGMLWSLSHPGAGQLKGKQKNLVLPNSSPPFAQP
jgi:hypothetical protein